MAQQKKKSPQNRRLCHQDKYRGWLSGQQAGGSALARDQGGPGPALPLTTAVAGGTAPFCFTLVWGPAPRSLTVGHPRSQLVGEPADWGCCGLPAAVSLSTVLQVLGQSRPEGSLSSPSCSITCPPVSSVTCARWLVVGISPCDWGVPAHTCQAHTPACCPGLTPVGTGWPSQVEGALSKGAVSSLPVFKRWLG